MQLSDLISSVVSDQKFLQNDSFCDRTPSRCVSCNGYYGPNFGQPYCAPCHAFLVPMNATSFWPDQNSGVCIHHADDVMGDPSDEDSGNEDPAPNEVMRSPQDLSVAVSFSDETESVVGAQPCSSASSAAQYTSPAPVAPSRPSESIDEYVFALTHPRDPIYDRMLAFGWVERVPIEVFLKIFRCMDDISLWSCILTCRRWAKIICTATTSALWEESVRNRWPLFQQVTPGAPVCWFRLYNQLIRAAPCIECLRLVRVPDPFDHQNNPGPRGPSALNRSESSITAQRLHSELKALRGLDGPEGVEALPLDSSLLRWMACIAGPPGSPYEGGKFYLLLLVPSVYPMRPPAVRFLTKIFHPNVSRHGDVGLDVLMHYWSLALTLSKVLLSIQSLMTDASTEPVCMEPDIGQLYREQRDLFNQTAQLWTWKYAMGDALML